MTNKNIETRGPLTINTKGANKAKSLIEAGKDEKMNTTIKNKNMKKRVREREGYKTITRVGL